MTKETTQATPELPKRNAFDIYSLSAWRKKRKKSEFDIYPSFNHRMIAGTLDSFVLILFTPLFDWLAPIDRSSLGNIAPPTDHPAPLSYMFVHLFGNSSFLQSWLHNFMLQLGFFCVYSGICWHFWSATPGKIVMRMKIVSAKTHERISLLQILLRLCGYIISGSFFTLGFLWIGLNKRKRGWHDYLADTEVIRHPWNLKRKPQPEPIPATPKDAHETAID